MTWCCPTVVLAGRPSARGSCLSPACKKPTTATVETNPPTTTGTRVTPGGWQLSLPSRTRTTAGPTTTLKAARTRSTPSHSSRLARQDRPARAGSESQPQGGRSDSTVTSGVHARVRAVSRGGFENRYVDVCLVGLCSLPRLVGLVRLARWPVRLDELNRVPKGRMAKAHPVLLRGEHCGVGKWKMKGPRRDWGGSTRPRQTRLRWGVFSTSDELGQRSPQRPMTSQHRQTISLAGHPAWPVPFTHERKKIG